MKFSGFLEFFKNRLLFKSVVFLFTLLILLITNSLYSTHSLKVFIYFFVEQPICVDLSVFKKNVVKSEPAEEIISLQSVALNNSNKIIELDIPHKEFTNFGFFNIELKKLSNDSSLLKVDSISVVGFKEKSEHNLRFNLSMNNKIVGKNIQQFKLRLKKNESITLTNTHKIGIKPILFTRTNYLVFSSLFVVIFFSLYFSASLLLEVKKKKHICNQDFIFFFCIIFITLIPLLFIDIKSINSKSENRVLAVYPKFLKNDNSLNFDYGNMFDKFFNDRFGQREYFIKLKDYVFKNNRVITASSAEGKIYGIDDNWYFVDGLLQLKADQKLLNKEKANLIKVANHYNCPVYVVIYPFKAHIYKEAIAAIYKNPSMVLVNEADKIASTLEDKQNRIYTIDLTNIFSKYKEQEPSNLIFYKDDHHQTEIGAYLAAKSVVERITDLHKKISFKDPSFKEHLGYMDIYGTTPNFMRGISYLRLGIRSSKEVYSLKNEYKNLTITDEYQNKVKHIEKRFRIHQYINNAPLIDKTVLVVGNSYVANTGRMLAYFFKETWQYNFMAGRFFETPLFNVDKDLKGKKIDYVIVAYFTNAVMSELGD